MRILVTGSRDWTDENRVRRALLQVSCTHHHPTPPTVVHGDCPTGADKIADDTAREFGWNVETHPPDWDEHGKAGGPIRNAEMVNLGADVCLAFPLEASRGTHNCIRLAHQAGIPVIVHNGPTPKSGNDD